MFSNNMNPGLYEVGSCSYDIDDGVFGSGAYHEDVDQINAKLVVISPKTTDEAKAAAASNSHKEAERHRRKRINGHIATLKSILPNAIKTDKASLLGEAVRRVREMKKRVAELSSHETKDESTDTTSSFMFPTETDEIIVRICEESHNRGLIKTTICCKDRPDLVLDLIRALQSVAAKVLKAEMSTVGGRIKTVLWVGGISDSGDLKSFERLLRRELKMVGDQPTLLVGSGPGHKRARWSPF